MCWRVIHRESESFVVCVQDETPLAKPLLFFFLLCPVVGLSHWTFHSHPHHFLCLAGSTGVGASSRNKESGRIFFFGNIFFFSILREAVFTLVSQQFAV